MPSASTRAVTSAELPGGNSTMNSIGFLPGKSCCAATSWAAPASAAKTNRRTKTHCAAMCIPSPSGPDVAFLPSRDFMAILAGFQKAPGASVASAERIVPANVIAVVLRRIAVDQRARVERMGEASHFVLKNEKRLSTLRVDDVSEAILVLAALLGDEPALEQAAVRPGEVGDVNLDVVPVVIRQRSRGFAETQPLRGAD